MNFRQIAQSSDKWIAEKTFETFLGNFAIGNEDGTRSDGQCFIKWKYINAETWNAGGRERAQRNNKVNTTTTFFAFSSIWDLLQELPPLPIVLFRHSRSARVGYQRNKQKKKSKREKNNEKKTHSSVLCVCFGIALLWVDQLFSFLPNCLRILFGRLGDPAPACSSLNVYWCGRTCFLASQAGESWLVMLHLAI